MELSPSSEANRFSASQKNSPHFMETENSSPRLQELSTCPYPKPDQSSPFPHFLRAHLNIILTYTPGSSKWSLSLRFPHQHLVYTCTLPQACEEYRLVSFISLECAFLSFTLFSVVGCYKHFLQIYCFHTEDGSGRFLLNFGKDLQE